MTRSSGEMVKEDAVERDARKLHPELQAGSFLQVPLQKVVKRERLMVMRTKEEMMLRENLWLFHYLSGSSSLQRGDFFGAVLSLLVA